MASFKAIVFFLFVGLVVGVSKAQLCPTFYDDSCPDVADIVRGVVQEALETDDRAGARLIRLHFHDCFVDVKHLISLSFHLCYSNILVYLGLHLFLFAQTTQLEEEKKNDHMVE